MALEYREISLSQEDTVKHEFWFVYKDYKDGLAYDVSSQLYNRAADLFGMDRVCSSVSAKKYLETFIDRVKELIKTKE